MIADWRRKLPIPLSLSRSTQRAGGARGTHQVSTHRCQSGCTHLAQGRHAARAALGHTGDPACFTPGSSKALEVSAYRLRLGAYHPSWMKRSLLLVSVDTRHRLLAHHANLAAAAPHNPGFQTVIFAGFPRVCMCSIHSHKWHSVGVWVKQHERGEYICAGFVPGYLHRRVFCITKSCGPCVTSKQFSTFRGARKTVPMTANTKELERVAWFSLPTHSPPMEGIFTGSLLSGVGKRL